MSNWFSSNVVLKLDQGMHTLMYTAEYGGPDSGVLVYWDSNSLIALLQLVSEGEVARLLAKASVQVQRTMKDAVKRQALLDAEAAAAEQESHDADRDSD